MPDINHPVIGFRSFKSHYVPGALRSLTYSSHIWTPGANHAQCLNPTVHTRLDPDEPIEVPGAHCNCGLQAHHDYDESLHYFMHTPGKSDYEDLVFGVIKGWGKTHVHPDGWRAEYAQIVAILPSPNQTWANMAAAFYNVPLLHAKDPERLEVIVSEYGKKVPLEARPEPEPTPIVDAAQRLHKVMVPNITFVPFTPAKPAPQPPALPIVESVATIMSFGTMYFLRKLLRKHGSSSS